MRMPYVMTWSGDVQYEVKRDYLVELQYMGQAGVGLINPYANQQNYPYPQFGTISYYSNFSHHTYHSLNLRFARRYGSGLAFSAYYTFQKTMTEQGLVDPFGKGRRWLNSGIKGQPKAALELEFHPER